MLITLQQVVPTFIEAEKVSASQIWNSNIVFTAGENIQIVAPSGSGKTSLIHFLYGLRKDYTGSILYDGKNISHFSAEDFALHRQGFISIVFQDLRLFPEHTVLQNLLAKHQLTPYHNEDKIAALESFGITNIDGSQLQLKAINKSAPFLVPDDEKINRGRSSVQLQIDFIVVS